MTSKGGISGTALATLAGGSVLLWSAIKGKAWSDVLRSLIKGEKPSDSQEYPINVPAPATANPGMTGPIQETPAGLGHSAMVIQNKASARLLAGTYGWSMGAEWDALVKLWEKESSWDNTAENKSSHAFGIPQALPWTKMPKAAWPVHAGGSASAVSQITWGLKYIKERYGSPSKALAFHLIHNWY